MSATDNGRDRVSERIQQVPPVQAQPTKLKPRVEGEQMEFCSTVTLINGQLLPCNNAVVSTSGRWITLDVQQENEEGVFVVSMDIPAERVFSHTRHEDVTKRVIDG